MELNNDTLRKLRGLILYTVILVAAAVNYKGILSVGQTLLGFVWPFILGAAIAFILNVPMRNIERRLPLFRPVSRARRPVSLVITIVLVSGILVLVIFVVTPQLFETLMSLQSSIPLFLGEVFKRAEELFASYPELTELFDQMNQITLDWPRMLNEVGSFLRTGAGSMLNTTFLAAKTVVNGLSTFLIGFIFALYILLQKETLNRQIKKLLRAFLPDSAVERVLGVARLTERTFSSFLTGQCVEAVILGTMFFIALTVLRLPYALLIGVLIAFTALIPIFGAFIGMGVGVFLMLMEAPADALDLYYHLFCAAADRGQSDLSPCGGRFRGTAVHLGSGRCLRGREHDGGGGNAHLYPSVLRILRSAAGRSEQPPAEEAGARGEDRG